MKWGTLYAPDYVNVLYSACKRNITGDFTFLCLTDDPTGLALGIEHRPIPDIGLTQPLWKSGGWAKLAVFQADLYGFTGRALFIDLDMVVNGSLDPFFDHPSPFVTTDMGTDWRPKPTGKGTVEPGTCIFAFTLGQQAQILERFVADREHAAASFGLEQAWVGAQASSMDFWPAGWVVSFKRHLRQPIGLDIFLPPRRPPAGSSVVAFHGTPRPIDLVKPGRALWDRPPHMGRGQVRWMVDYWVRNGGRLSVD